MMSSYSSLSLDFNLVIVNKSLLYSSRDRASLTMCQWILHRIASSRVARVGTLLEAYLFGAQNLIRLE